MAQLSFPADHIITGAEWQQFQDFAIPLYVRKTSDENVTSSTTMQNDDDLYITVKANAVYLIRSFIIYTGTTTNDIKVGWTVPTGSVFTWSPWSPDVAMTANQANVNWAAMLTSDVSSSGAVAGAPYQTMRPTGTLVVGTVDGTFRLQWAQNVSGGTATTIKTGSYLVGYRIS